MKNKLSTLQQAEEILKPLATPHVPQESLVEAVIDQCVQFLATKSVILLEQWHQTFSRGSNVRLYIQNIELSD